MVWSRSVKQLRGRPLERGRCRLGELPLVGRARRMSHPRRYRRSLRHRRHRGHPSSRQHRRWKVVGTRRVHAGGKAGWSGRGVHGESRSQLFKRSLSAFCDVDLRSFCLALSLPPLPAYSRMLRTCSYSERGASGSRADEKQIATTRRPGQGRP